MALPLYLVVFRCRHLLQFDYDNGVGSKVDRFKIDLYEADGNGDCGTWVTSICDKPTIGCKDSSKCRGFFRLYKIFFES